jgi:hypothetical protein
MPAPGVFPLLLRARAGSPRGVVPAGPDHLSLRSHERPLTAAYDGASPVAASPPLVPGAPLWHRGRPVRTHRPAPLRSPHFGTAVAPLMTAAAHPMGHWGCRGQGPAGGALPAGPARLLHRHRTRGTMLGAGVSPRLGVEGGSRLTPPAPLHSDSLGTNVAPTAVAAANHFSCAPRLGAGRVAERSRPAPITTCTAGQCRAGARGVASNAPGRGPAG